MIVLNFSHPLTPEQVQQLTGMTGQFMDRVVEVASQFDEAQPFEPQVAALADGCGLTEAEWQTTPLLIVPPALNFIAVTLMAELHGRMGYFPTCVRLRPVAGARPPRYEIAELLDLQTIRGQARQRR